MPDLHGEQAALPFFFGSRPCGHWTHVDEPATPLTLPAGHKWQFSMPVELPNCPGRHGKHAAVPFSSCEKPTGHASQKVAFMSPVRNRPLSHTTQAAAAAPLATFFLMPYFPATHFEHLALPGSSENCPMSQSVQFSSPEISVSFPISQR